MHAEHLEAHTAVGLARAAGHARSAVEVWLDRAAIARRQLAGYIRRQRDDLDAQLVAEDPRVAEERLHAAEGVQIGATDADALDAHQRVARCQLARRFGV